MNMIHGPMGQQMVGAPISEQSDEAARILAALKKKNIDSGPEAIQAIQAVPEVLTGNGPEDVIVRGAGDLLSGIQKGAGDFARGASDFVSKKENVMPLAAIVQAVGKGFGAAGGQPVTAGPVEEMLSNDQTRRQRAMAQQLGEQNTQNQLTQAQKVEQLQSELVKISQDPNIPEDQKDVTMLNKYKEIMGSSVLGDVLKKKMESEFGGAGALSESEKAARDWEMVKTGKMTVRDFMVIHPQAFTSYSTLDPEGLAAAVEKQKLISAAQKSGEYTPGNIGGAVKKAGAVKTVEQQIGSTAQQNVGAAEVNRLSDTQQGITMLDNLVESSPSFKSLSNSPLDIARVMNPWDEDVKSFDQLVASTRQVIGKGLEGGVLRKEDEAKYAKILPSLGEPISLRQKKATQLRSMLANKYNTDLQSLGSANFKTGKFAPVTAKVYGEGNIPSFATEEEAIAAGVKIGETVIIDGVKGRIK